MVATFVGCFGDCAAAEDRLEEMLETVSIANQSTYERQQRENHQRNQHYHGTLMRLAVAMSIMTMRIVGSVPMSIDVSAVIVAEEGHEQQAEHIERCNERGDDAAQP